MNRSEMADFMDTFFEKEVKTRKVTSVYNNEGAYKRAVETFSSLIGRNNEEAVKTKLDVVAIMLRNLFHIAEKEYDLDLDEFMKNKLHSLRQSGQEEYARKEHNAFGNFERIADMLDSTREEVLIIYFWKHIDGIMSWYEGNKNQREELMDRLGDACVYLFLLAGMVEDDRAVV